MEGSLWFRRLRRECKAISPHIRFKRVKLGFYRIYWKTAYIHEVYKEMPHRGYDIEDEDPRFESQKFSESKEDQGEITRKIKNYVEGYTDSIERIRTRVYLMRHNDDFNEQSTKAYKQYHVK